MQKMYLPEIERAKFDAFVGIIYRENIREFPLTYEVWCDKHAERVAEYSGTYEVFAVPVDPDDFDAFTKENAKEPDFTALLLFAETLGKQGKGRALSTQKSCPTD